jgi:carbamoyltransferase
MAHDPDLRQRVNIARSSFPAITHVDYSARIQTVDPERHGRFYRLLKMFEQHTGCPMLVNTSFNVRGEPIVCTPDDALRCFLATDMDLLVLENFIASKKEITRLPSAAEKAEHLAAFQPD